MCWHYKEAADCWVLTVCEVDVEEIAINHSLQDMSISSYSGRWILFTLSLLELDTFVLLFFAAGFVSYGFAASRAFMVIFAVAFTPVVDLVAFGMA
jgi:hypothetical protein